MRALMMRSLLLLALLGQTATSTSTVCEDKVLDDASTLLQTVHHQRQSSQSEAPAVLSSEGSRESSDSSQTEAGARGTACFRSYLHDVMVGTEMPEMIGYLPDSSSCQQSEQLVLSQVASLFQQSADSETGGFKIPPVTIVFVFAALCMLFIFNIIYSVLTLSRHSAKGIDPTSMESRYPESAAWKRNKIDWLWMGWATGWVSRWGTAENSALTKISSKDIPMSDPDDECELCFRRFDRLWKEELARVGNTNASLLKVVTRFVTYRKVFSIGFWNAFYEGFLFLGPPLAIKWVTKFLNWLYTQRSLGMTITGAQLLWPSCLLIVIFCGLPLLMAVSNSMCTMLNGRISIRMDGALCLAVYDKAQRLPVVQDDADDISLNIGPGTKKKGDLSEKHWETEEDEAFDKEPVSEAEKLWANNGVNKRFNLVQVVTNDINTNLMTIPNSLARMVVMVPVLCGTLIMLIGEIGVAFVFSLAMALLNLALMTSIGFLMRSSLGMFYATSGKRLQFLQEVMLGIRFIKGCGAEHIVMDRMGKARAWEIRSLDKFYTIQCFMFIMSLQLPRLYILASLGGYALFHHGDVEPTVIMALLPLLMSVQGAIGVVFSLIPTLVMALPSCRRLETFLKLKEAPRSAPLAALGVEPDCPPYCTVTPAEEKKPNLRVQGAYSWQSWSKPTLKDLDICVRQGELVAIIGPVGCGKTTLLHAILGELHPSGDSRLEVPKRIAYSAQSAHLFEGSLRDNILKGDEIEHDRYKETIYCSCLVPDLEILPGGDDVPVGGRGISLSGGQKARVSLARAAYDKADLVLLDDPFAAVDAHTSRHLNDNLVHGPLMRTRTRVIVMQPENERILRCDNVIIMKEGQVILQGPPKEIMGTPEYEALQSSVAHGEEEEMEAPQTRSKGNQLIQEDGYELREEECEGRASWATIAYFCRMGGWLGIGTCIIMYLIKNVLDMRTQVQLSMWMSHGSMYDAGLTTVKPNPWTYILNYIFWMCGSTVAWFICWVGGQSWTLGISEGCHNSMIRALMRAPVDRFYDKTPVGRIMNRMANDMMNVDMQVFVGCCSSIGMVWSTAVPIYYVHLTMPLWFTLATIPFYYLCILLIGLYWKTMVPLRYLMQVSKSGVSTEIAEVESTPATVRAYGMQEYRLQTFALAVRKMISADFLGGIVCIRWLCNRLFVLGGCFTTGLALVTIWIPNAMDVGGASLVINTMFTIIVSIEASIHTGSMAQYQIIAMNRIYEYTSLPEEREEVLESDSVFKNLTVKVMRKAMGTLECVGVNTGRAVISRSTAKEDERLLEQLPDKPCFVVTKGKSMSDLAPRNTGLREAHPWHRIVAVNGLTEKASDMVDELCYGNSEEILLYIISGWLADGVKVDIKELRVGYADVPSDVLHGISISIPRRFKTGVVGPTGCGKSTLLLTLLRMLEPRSGAIYMEGVDTQTIGLRTLRTSIGLVPQDPVLLQGTLRFNIDPFEMYPDSRIWEALQLVCMADYVKNLPGGLEYSVSGEGSNLSFGQRQLLSLARNIVRKPMLLLLDEATSAIDPRTQELLQATIEKAFPEATMVVIAHRLETILEFDLAIVMDRGHVVEQGSVKELANLKQGRLAKMLAAKGLSVKL
eukprot:CAMPEP_0204565086 /NCGR_PEP_ID=MMETSP0661-20131031/35260_1 /ASSEMBLY_ACC=CAM_ASM_000606 /TAXON_ID=109239 /ORGANISM="Alexandrium margalefi, Strain AMGDE01CS-322" /LENGTH=1610 /DNA_ID=CAMNT_0051572797 /DNA_START=113 /DNA_END=4945 /DNA_ORIENTATION=+